MATIHMPRKQFHVKTINNLGLHHIFTKTHVHLLGPSAPLIAIFVLQLPYCSHFTSNLLIIYMWHFIRLGHPFSRKIRGKQLHPNLVCGIYPLVKQNWLQFSTSITSSTKCFELINSCGYLEADSVNYLGTTC